MNCPAVLFLIFNRPGISARVFEEIRRARPKQLFVAADGPRIGYPNDEILCSQTRALIDCIAWPCEVHTLFRKDNLGCAIAVSSAIDWFFEHVEMGVILEDDCLPHASFFRFCGDLLERYKRDERIMHISGASLQDGTRRTQWSYFFSSIPHVWGWATWRRAWQMYELGCEDLNEFWSLEGQQAYCQTEQQSNYYYHLFKEAATVKHTWDAQWVYAVWKNRGLAITPEVNLVSNLGFGSDATHTIHPNSREANQPVADIGEIAHPPMITRSVVADKFTFEKYVKEQSPKLFERSINFLGRKLRFVKRQFLRFSHQT